MRLLAIDPGRRTCAWSAWYDCRLIGAGLARIKGDDAKKSTGDLAVMLAAQIPIGADEVVLEGMVIQYDRTKDPQDMMDLQAIGCFVAGIQRPSKLTLTDGTMWKNNRPKEIQHRMDQKMLYPEELRLLKQQLSLVIPSLQHNVLDAVGIGLSHLKAKRRCMKPIIR